MLNPEQERDESLFKDPETGIQLDVVEKVMLTEWIANNYKSFGAQLEFVTNK